MRRKSKGSATHIIFVLTSLVTDANVSFPWGLRSSLSSRNRRWVSHIPVHDSVGKRVSNFPSVNLKEKGEPGAGGGGKVLSSFRNPGFSFLCSRQTNPRLISLKPDFGQHTDPAVGFCLQTSPFFTLWNSIFPPRGVFVQREQGFYFPFKLSFQE